MAMAMAGHKVTRYFLKLLSTSLETMEIVALLLGGIVQQGII